MNASIASPWHRARIPICKGRNRCNVCQRHLGSYKRAWTAAACSADNEVFFQGASAQASALSRAPGVDDDQISVEPLAATTTIRPLRIVPISLATDLVSFVSRCTGDWRLLAVELTPDALKEAIVKILGSIAENNSQLSGTNVRPAAAP